MQQKTAIIFGGTGFVGRHIVQHLCNQGWHVRVATRVLSHAAPLRQMGTAVGQVTPIVVEPRDQQQAGRAMAGCDVVVNCIGIIAQNPRQSFDVVHGEIPGILARAAVANGVRQFVHISALGADANSASHYARSKAAGEGVVRALFPSAVILRPSVIFGPDDSFFNRFARMAQMLPFLPLIEGGRTQFQPVYVGDVAAAALNAVTRADAAGKIFELGGPAVYTFKKLLQLLLLQIKRHRLLVPVNTNLMMFKAGILERLPGQLVTRDQLLLLKQDNVVQDGAKTLRDLNVSPTAVEAILPMYLDQYRPKGRF